MDMKEFATQYASNIHSQNNEDGIIAEVLKRIKRRKGVAVEFGGADGFYCSNTAALRSKGWQVYMYDIEAAPPYVEAKRITTDNINELPQCDVLSIDVDGPDMELWQAHTGAPDLVIIEINSSLAPMVHRYNPEWGASYIAMLELGIAKNYFLLCHTGNMLFVHNRHREKFPEIVGDGITNYREYFKEDWL
jgi:hypothetical protein